MKERPIIFTAESIRAILAGTKTQTRRVVNLTPQGFCDPQPSEYAASAKFIEEKGWEWWGPINEEGRGLLCQWGVNCPHGVVGDRLWVKETWALTKDKPQWTAYRATSEFRSRAGKFEKFQVFDGPWKGPRFMPRVASRLTLEITGIRVERVQDITEKDAEAEGVEKYVSINPGARWMGGAVSYRLPYSRLWTKINGKRGFGWDTNCWVWVIEFRRVP